MEESDWTYDEEDYVREIKVEPIKNSYNSYLVSDKEKRDWNGNFYLLGFLGILLIAYLC